MAEMAEDIELREHIHSILSSYSRTHYTTDYVEFTNDFVAEYLETIHLIPTTDPNALILPADPMSTLLKLHNIDTLTFPDESWAISSEAVVLLRSFIKESNQKLKSERVVTDGSYAFPYIPDLPELAMLTARARRATDGIGKGKLVKELASSLPTLKTNLEQFGTPRIEEIPDPEISLDQVLGVGAAVIPKEEMDEVLALIKYTSNATKERPERLAWTDSPLLECPKLDSFDLPLFPRSKRSGHGIAPGPLPAAIAPRKFQDLARIIEPEAPLPSSEDIADKNMRLMVDGWETIPSSSGSDSDSPPSSPGDQVDELCMPLTPDTDPPFIKDVCNPILDIMIPRSRRVGGLDGVQDNFFKGKTYESYIAGMMPKIEMPEIMPPLDDSDAGSVVGRASTARTELHDGLAAEILSLHGDKNFDSFLDEEIDDTATFRLDPPVLPPPTEHSPAVFVPRCYRDLCASKTKQEDYGTSFRALFKKARVPQSLAVSLSWVAFKVGQQLPTNAEVVDAAELLSSRPGSEPVDEQLVEDVGLLLSKCQLYEAFDFDEITYRKWTWSDEWKMTFDEIDGSPIMLTCMERRRIAGKRKPREESQSPRPSSTLPTQPSPGPHVEVLELEDVGDIRPLKRARPTDPVEVAKDPVLSPILSDSLGLSYCEDDKENWNHYSLPPSDFVDQLFGSEDRRMPVSYLSTLAEDVLEDDQEIFDHDFDMLDDGTHQSFEPLPVETQPNNPGDCAVPEQASQSSDDSFYVPDADYSKKAVVSTNAKLDSTLFNCSRGVLGFARLRSTKFAAALSDDSPLPMEAVDSGMAADNTGQPTEESTASSTGPPEGMFDRNTIRVDHRLMVAPTTAHRCLASVDVLQRRALVRLLGSADCLVDLIERETLDGVHLILDPFTAVLFIPLLTLPSKSEEWTKLISAQTPRYSHLYIIFEAYPESCALKSRPERENELSAYTPPIVKAVQRFRRTINITMGLDAGEGARGCEVGYGLAESVSEAARLVRVVGDMAKERDVTGGVIWDGRVWLEDESESEADLCSVQSINRFSAALILSQMTLEEFLGSSPEARVSMFGSFVGKEAMDSFNREIMERYSEYVKSSSSIVGDG
ncbi:hypothetical protein FA15DRAFT_760752 [Coprinopsis marcescibilis]|uniref:Uncharacterized protein n=1 Tax=Coprinopsis marcescibilis TaxID=230819 RepID=A0A5C3KDQ9_COPMA|nr:hypothetical protein FA15DRAFT_760752 [Coprinopsis marcescibilis]